MGICGRQFVHSSQRDDRKVIKLSFMKTINACLVTTNKVIFCTYFSDIVSKLYTPNISGNKSKVTDIPDPAIATIEQFNRLFNSIQSINSINRPSIMKTTAKDFKSIFFLNQTNKIEIKKNTIRGMNIFQPNLSK